MSYFYLVKKIIEMKKNYLLLIFMAIIGSTYAQCLSGTYTVDPSAPISATNYQTLTDVITDLNTNGVCGPTTFNLAATTFSGSLSFGAITGASATNLITFNGVDSASTILTSAGTVDNSTISLTGATYLTFKNLKIVNTKTGTDTWGVHLMSSCSNITIDSCKIELTYSTSSDRAGVCSSGSTTSASSDGDNADFLTISNCKIEGSYYGIYLNGESSTTGFDNDIVIHNNEIIPYYYGIYLDNINGLEITHNKIEALNSLYADGIYSFDLLNYNISYNNIHANDYGFYISDGNYDAVASVQSVVSNNMISSETDYGGYFYDIESTNFFHNSFSGEPGARFYNPEDLDIRNNIFVSDGDFAFEESTGTITDYISLDYNVYYTNYTYLVDFGPSYATLADWLLDDPTLNNNSLEGNPFFLSSSDLHLAGYVANDAGDNTVGILDDIDGEVRPQSPSTTVDIGADEYTPSSCGFPDNLVTFNTYPTSTDITFSSTNAVSYIVEYGPANFTLGTGTQITSTNDTITLTSLSPETEYDFYIRTVCSSDTSLWSPGGGSFTTPCAIEAFPYFENFESVPTNTRGDFGNCWTGSGTTTSVYRWESENSTGANENSSNTGPFYDKTLEPVAGGIYIYTEASSGSTGDVTYLYSPLVDLSTALVPRISFWYHLYGSTMGDLSVEISTDFVTWTTLYTLSGQQQTAGDDLWLNHKVDISSYAGDTVQIRFAGTKGSSYYSDMSLDDVSIEETPTNDISIVSQVSPEEYDCGSTSSPLIVEVANLGSDNQYNVPVVVELTGDYVGTYTVTVDSILSLDTVLVTVGTYDNSAGGVVTVTSYPANPGDQVSLNDTVVTVATIGAIPNPLTVNGTTICAGDSSTFYNTTGDLVRWMLASNDSVLSTEDTFTVSPDVTTSYKAELFSLSNMNVGETSAPTAGTYLTGYYGIAFETQTDIIINSVVVYPSGTGEVTIGLYDEDADSVIATATDSVTDGGSAYSTPALVDLNFEVSGSATSSYRLVYLGGLGVSGLGRSYSASFPYVSGNGLVSLNNSTTTLTGTSTYYYYYFYDWTISLVNCPSDPTYFDVTVGQHTDTTITVSACESYTYNGNTVTSSGLYVENLTSSLGCDSTVRYDVTINTPYNISQTLNICDLDTVMIGNNSYSTTGVYVDTLLSVTGCDSIVTSEIIVNTIGTVSVEGLTPQICSNVGAIVLTPDPLGGVFTGNGIVGNYFDPALAGEGTHTITYDYVGPAGCTANISLDVEVTVCSGIKDIAGITAVALYPNPFVNQINLQFTDENAGELTISLFDASGKLIVSNTVETNFGTNNIEVMVPESTAFGVHFIQIEREGQTYSSPLMKK